ncbi:MAG TPA: tetratricopeptide repeat protein [Gemmataceae bacterium]|jgi:tetratricopeptide (TPR) repeat protein|nr:tetratricopeptide repeat protein [Gemmataceae bacterium]
MRDPQALAMLALRRIQGRVAIHVDQGSNGSDEHDAEGFDPACLTAGDTVALGRVLRRAIERTWLTMALLFNQDAVGRKLGRGGQATLDSILANRCFNQLNAIPGPFRQTIGKELHDARQSGPLAQHDVDVDVLLRQMSGLTRTTDPRALQDLEWYSLWQAASEVAREGFPQLRSLFEVRASAGESLLVGLVTTFVPFELELEGNSAHADAGSALLPPDHVRWLCEQSEPIEQFLNEIHGGVARAAAPAETAARVRQGLTYVQHGEYERAVVEFTAAIQSDPRLVSPYVSRGDALRLRGEYERAIADYSQALRLEPQHLAALLNRGLVYRMTGRPELALTDLTEALRLDAKNVVARNGRGGAHADLKQYDQAVADHTQALRIDPSLAWAHQSRGDAYAGLGEFDRAIADYTQALRLNPHFPLAHANRGDAYRLAGDLDRAAADYTEALRLDPLNPRILTNRGDAYRRQSRFELALADYAEAIRLDPTNPAGYLNRGITYQLAGDLDKAVASFDEAEQFDPANPVLFFQRALAYREGESYEAAITDLGRAIDLNPRDAGAFINRGCLYALTDELDAAIDDLTEAIRLDPTAARARLERGRIQQMRGAFDEALADCADAIRLDEHLVPAMLLRGGVLIRMGSFESALEELDRAIRVNPRYARAYNDRGVANSKLGRFDEAIRDFTRATELVPEYAQALANRANAFQLNKRHGEALRDYTQAVILDAKYAANYSLVRGQVEAGRGNFRQALADFAVALSIDPKSRTIRQARADAQAQREHETDFAVAPAVELTVAAPPVVETARAPEPEPTQESAAPETQAAIDFGEPELALEEAPKATAPRRPAEPTQFAMAAPTQIAMASTGMTAAERAEYEAEQEQFRKAEEQARLRELSERAAAMRRQNEAAAKMERALGKPTVKARRRRDPDEITEQRRKYKQYAVIAIGLLIGGYWGIQGAWALIPRAKNPYKVYAADQFVGEYAKDANAADEKFADQLVCVKGKLSLVRDKRLKIRDTAPQVFFNVPGQKDDLKVECLFDDPDTIAALTEEQEYTIVGKVEKFKPGKGIKLKSANILAGNEAKIAAWRPGCGSDLALAKPNEAKNSRNLQPLFTHSTLALPMNIESQPLAILGRHCLIASTSRAIERPRHRPLEGISSVARC